MGMKKAKRQRRKLLYILVGILTALLCALFLLVFFTNRANVLQEEPQDPGRVYAVVNNELGSAGGIEIIHAYIPWDSPRRPGEVREIRYITIHETDNRSRGSDAEAHSRYLLNDANDSTSWHYTVDDGHIYHHLPDNEIAWNAGDQRTKYGGNINGIGIEMCVNIDGNYDQTLRNTAALTAALLDNYGMTMDDVRFHSDFMHKVCPHRLITEGRTGEFLHMIEEDLLEIQAAKAAPAEGEGE